MAKVFDFTNTEFNLDNFPNHHEIDVDWSRSGYAGQSSMNSIASYLAMFAPAMPKFFIDSLTEEGDLIFDPFSGRGTTALTARQTNRRFVGSDLNPYALVLSKAKVSNVSLDQILDRINELEALFNVWVKSNRRVNERVQFNDLKPFYSPNVLRQLIFVRTTFGQEWRNLNSVDNCIIAFALGLMHGPSRKDGSTIYFSLKMPNTISMAPNYVRKFAAEHNLERPQVNIFEQIKKRVINKYDVLIGQNFDGEVREHDALKNFEFIADNSVSLLITSPPYLSIVNYTRSNWLKLWLLGYDLKSIKNIRLSDKLSFDGYIEFITTFLNNVYNKIEVGGHVALIVGDVHEERLIEKVWDVIKNNVQFNLKMIYWDDAYLQTKKVTNMLNNRKGKATTIEKVLLLVK